METTVPTLLIFFLLALVLLFPVQMIIILRASKEQFGKYSLKSAWIHHQKMSWWKVILFATLLWGFAGLMSVTILPLELSLFAPIRDRLLTILPPSFDWTNLDVLEHYSRNILLATAIGYLLLNGFVGPIVEELFFRGYLTSRLSRFGSYTPLIVTVLFSLYHFGSRLTIFSELLLFIRRSILHGRRKIFISPSFFTVCAILVSAIGFIVFVFTL
ncbi:MAG: CPBP family intramembrane metalloprotease [Bacillaceae bacterium]|nr:CPBP family intramembrane metalloprotease [Bacillaceae bacterium]